MAGHRQTLLAAVVAVCSAACSRTALVLGERDDADDDDDETTAAPEPDCPGAADLSQSLAGRVRDFPASHPDFENFIGDDPGIVLPELGDDGVPVYAGVDGNPSTSGKDTFDQWYRDVSGVNLGADLALTLALSPPYAWVADRPEFFPIDGQLLGNEGNSHNFHFTVELHTTFRQRGGEVFSFEGDDDLWAFVDGKLVLDLGGVHGSEGAAVEIDSLGLEPGALHSLDLFYAERHTSESVLRIRLEEFVLCGS